MKKEYQKPSIKLHKIETTDILAASPSIGGNTGIGTGEGEPPSGGDAKQGFFNDEDDQTDNVWDD